ncbi:DUF2062 domain-containing protein [Oceanibacterium hippocampi]|uniref:DUF2062 domain-containing protein n=1 Tax=Oceanibacterium hippocampi TaxID=745714 RepID=A0A1Y5TYZ1_9PROT|nr:DUF2062 domain-containing protein [Oceanibacterium hippocampi]SLN77074.1 hypothetical protein OCH7691_04270 [Oceanibacterium hippocampi]
MFRRRQNRPTHHRLRDFLWPTMGFRRFATYVAHRVARMPGTPYSLAAGFAWGSAVSFTPFVGLHFFLAALGAWATRANILASAIGTVVGNPWTFPFIWTFLYEVGSWLIGRDDPATAIGIGAALQRFWEAALNGEWAVLTHIAWSILLPMMVAAVPIAVIAWVATFYPLRFLIESYQNERRRRRGQGAKRRGRRRVNADEAPRQ